MFGLGPSRPEAQLRPLGPLEEQVMEVVWTHGQSSVRDVAVRLPRRLAYTTVMTTLDRLFKKGLLERQSAERAFLYAPRLTREAWKAAQARELVARFFAGPQAPRELLLSSLLDAAGPLDEAQLDELERQIQIRRRQLAAGKQGPR